MSKHPILHSVAVASALGLALSFGVQAAESSTGASGMQSGSSEAMQSRSETRSSGTTSQAGQMDQTLSQAKAKDVIGKEVVNADGKKIGTVSEVSRHEPGNALQLVVKTGGHLGLGEKHMAVPLDQVRMQGNEIHLKQEMTQSQVEQHVASYDKKSFKPITREQRDETMAALESGSKTG